MNEELKAYVKPILTRHEGKRYRPYRCSAGKWTIGVGHNYQDNPLPNDIARFLTNQGYITDTMIDMVLELDTCAAISGCNKLFPNFNTISIKRQAALVDLVFNMGTSKIKKDFPSFVKAVIVELWDSAVDELEFSNGKTKLKQSGYWTQLGGDAVGEDDGKLERPEEVCQMLREG